MKYKVKLRLFQDDANGEWGLAHDNAIDIDTPFNSFWSPQGIFHDVFEHYFEGTSRYFQGENSFNIGGEIAAMGHFAYYMSEFYLDGRAFDRYGFRQGIDLAAIDTTHRSIEEAVTSGYCSYGNTLLCAVPYQKRSSRFIEGVIEEHWYKCKRLSIEVTDCDYLQDAIDYRQSLSRSKFQRLYRWGWNQAKKIAPRNYRSRDVLEKFIEHWKFVTEHNSAEEIARIYKYLEFTIFGGEKLDWRAHWVTHEGFKVDGNGRYPEDAYIELFAEEEY